MIVFPGSNCDHDAQHALSEVAGFEADFVWHAETDLAEGLRKTYAWYLESVAPGLMAAK